MRVAMFEGDVALHIFDDHDRVVDNQSGGQGDTEHGERVDGEAEDLDESEGADERDWDGDGGDDGRTPIHKEEEDDDDDDDDGFSEGLDYLSDGVAHDGGGVEGDLIVEPGREGLLQVVERRLCQTIDFERIGVGELLHADADGRPSIES